MIFDKTIVLYRATCGVCLCPSYCNGDGTVNVSNLLAIIDVWGTDSGCDVNGDGMIDVIDLLAVVDTWGECP